MVESVRMLESASLGFCDVADRIEEYLPEAEATLTVSLRSRGHDPAAVAAADRMLAGLRPRPGCRRALGAEHTLLPCGYWSDWVAFRGRKRCA